MALDQDSIELVVFDAYGTLLDVHAAIAVNRDALGDEAEPLSHLWRQKQLEYSWLTALRGDYQDFWALTEKALRYAFQAFGLPQDSALFQNLLESYWRLAAFPDTAPCLGWLREQGFQSAILSNGSPEMLRGAVESAGISARLDAIFSVDDIGTYKPDPRVYEMPLAHFKLKKQEVLFISSNTWDVAATKNLGFQVIWLNRNDDGQLDHLDGAPNETISSLDELPDLLF